MAIFDEIKGIVFAFNMEIPGEYSDIAEKVFDGNIEQESSDGTIWCIDKRLHKFSRDEVLYKYNSDICFLDGYVENKQEICRKNDEIEWERGFYKEIISSGVDSLRGGFCGFYFDGSKYRLFSDHVGNRSLYYYIDGKACLISNRLFYVIDILKKNGIQCNVDENAIRYLLTLGFMPDDSTVCNEIKRVLPGCYVNIIPGVGANKSNYYMPDNTRIQNDLTYDEAIEGLDHYFRQAVKREYDKDEEYGYKHLVDLSGGLDSRMTSWVAHNMGYQNQVNIAYCQKDYLDFRIAQQIACDLRHKFIYMPLDDFKWIEDIEINTKMLNASTPYAASTGARHILDMIKGCDCGIEHTGMVGDAIIGTFYKDSEYNYSKPEGNENAYSTILNYNISTEILEQFANREQFSLYTRGLLGAQSSYMLRQNYFETASPFLDADFLTYILSVPFEYRTRHKLYLSWINVKYPKAAKYGWEKWHGARPTEQARLFSKKMLQLKYSISRKVSNISRDSIPVGMTPADYWYRRHSDTAEYINEYYFNCSKALKGLISCDLMNDMEKMYNIGKTMEKEQILTVFASVIQLT